MQVRPPHTLVHGPDGLPREDLTPETVRQWVALCAQLGVTAIFWYVNYVGKATYHSDVLPPMTSVTPGHFQERGIGPGRAAALFTRIGVDQ